MIVRPDSIFGNDLPGALLGDPSKWSELKNSVAPPVGSEIDPLKMPRATCCALAHASELAESIVSGLADWVH